jgi:hypothetical protein
MKAAAQPFLRLYVVDRRGWSDQEVRPNEEAMMRSLANRAQRRGLTAHAIADLLSVYAAVAA